MWERSSVDPAVSSLEFVPPPEKFPTHGVVDQEGDVVTVDDVHIGERIRVQVVDVTIGKIQGVRAVDDIAAVPVRRRAYSNRQISGRVDLNRLVTEPEVRIRDCVVIEPDALKPGEGRELADVEVAAADQRQNIRPRAARQAVTRVQRRRDRIHSVVAGSSGNGVGAGRQRKIGHIVEFPLGSLNGEMRLSCFGTGAAGSDMIPLRKSYSSLGAS